MKARTIAAVFILSGLILLVGAPAGAEDVYLEAAGPTGIGHVGMYYGLINPADGSWYEADLEDFLGIPYISRTWTAVVDTGASACILGKTTRDVYEFLGTVIPMQDGVSFTDVGFGGTVDYDVTEPVRMMLAGQKDACDDPDDLSRYTAYGPVGESVPPPPTITMAAARELLCGGGLLGIDVDIIGTSILQGRVLQVDPDVSHLGFARVTETMAGALVENPPAATDPGVVYVPMTMEDFSPASDDVDFGEHPMLSMRIRRTASDDFASREALFDTGSQLTFVSASFAEDAGIDLTDEPDLSRDICGVGGSETRYGYEVDALALELGAERDGDLLIIGNTTVFIIPDDEMPGTLDGSKRLDAILGNGAFSPYRCPLSWEIEPTDVVEWYVDMRDGSENLIIVIPEPATITLLILVFPTLLRRRRCSQ